VPARKPADVLHDGRDNEFVNVDPRSILRQRAAGELPANGRMGADAR
jgi:hypothetical protein